MELKSMKHKSFVLIPQDIDGLNLLGYLITRDKNFRLNVSLQSTTSLQGARFSCDWQMKELLAGYEDIVLKRMQQSESLVQFLEELKMLMENLLSFNTTWKTKNIPARFLREVMTEFHNIGWKRVVYFNEEIDVAKIVYRDASDRQHTITFYIQRKDTTMEFSYLVDLPVPLLQNEENQDKQTLSQTYGEFIKVVDRYQSFWNLLKDIDDKLWVIEPEKPSYDCLYRRIALGKNSSLRVVLNPNQPASIPECRFFGPSQVIEPIKENLTKNIHCWDDNKGLIENLTNVLGMTFPTRCATNEEEARVECGICYTYDLNGALPEHWCNNPKCGQVFHVNCLIEWLQSVPAFRRNFNVICGECPYCGKKQLSTSQHVNAMR